MRRILLLLTVAAMMAVMMVASATPVFAEEGDFVEGDILLPPNPIKGQAVSSFARSLPPNPIKGQLVSQFAKNFGQVT